MNEVFAAQETADGMMRPWYQRATLAHSYDMFRFAPNGGERKAISVVGSEMARHRIAQPDRLFEHRVEDCRKIAGRTIDDFQDLRHRVLALQCLRQIPGET